VPRDPPTPSHRAGGWLGRTEGPAKVGAPSRLACRRLQGRLRAGLAGAGPNGGVGAATPRGGRGPRGRGVRAGGAARARLSASLRAGKSRLSLGARLLTEAALAGRATRARFVAGCPLVGPDSPPEGRRGRRHRARQPPAILP
jgi:hypothetical protein